MTQPVTIATIAPLRAQIGMMLTKWRVDANLGAMGRVAPNAQAILELHADAAELLPLDEAVLARRAVQQHEAAGQLVGIGEIETRTAG